MKNPRRCIVLNCSNHENEGLFVGSMCAPCWGFVVEGRGVHSQAFRNAAEAIAFAAVNHVNDDRVLLVRREPGYDIAARGQG
jgi:hypothetical protein